MNSGSSNSTEFLQPQQPSGKAETMPQSVLLFAGIGSGVRMAHLSTQMALSFHEVGATTTRTFWQTLDNSGLPQDVVDALKNSDKENDIKRTENIELTWSQQQHLLWILSYIDWNDPSVRRYVDYITQRDDKGKPFNEKAAKPEMRLNVIQLCKDFHNGTSREREIAATVEELFAIANKKQLTTQYLKGKRQVKVQRANTLIEIQVNDRIELTYNEIRRKQGLKKGTPGEIEKKYLVECTITLNPLFFLGVTSSFAPVYPDRLANIKAFAKQKGPSKTLRKVFDLLNANWASRFITYINVMKAATQERKQALKGLTAKALLRMLTADERRPLEMKVSTADLRDLASNGPSSNQRMINKRFKTDLTEEAIPALVEYGIISKGEVSKDWQFVTFTYNPLFARPNEYEILTRNNQAETQQNTALE